MTSKTGIRQPIPIIGSLLGLSLGTLAVGFAFIGRGEPNGVGTSVAPGVPQAEPPASGTFGQTSKVPPKSSALSLEDRADIFMARKEYADAVDYYHRALRQTGLSNAALWNKLGIAQQQQLNHRAAIKAYKEAIHQRNNFSEAWNNLGTVYFLEDKFRKSLKFYLRAIELNPNSASFHLNLASSYYRLKKVKEAIDECRVALTLDPNILTERASVGTVVQARGSDAEFHFYLAKVFASLGRAEDAVRHLRRAFEDGFKDGKRLRDDPDFQKISKDPAYVQLLENPPVPIQD